MARVVLEKRDRTGDINLGLGFRDLLFLRSGWLRAISAAVFKDILSVTKKGRMAVKMDLSILWFVPFR